MPFTALHGYYFKVPVLLAFSIIRTNSWVYILCFSRIHQQKTSVERSLLLEMSCSLALSRQRVFVIILMSLRRATAYSRSDHLIALPSTFTHKACCISWLLRQNFTGALCKVLVWHSHLSVLFQLRLAVAVWFTVPPVYLSTSLLSSQRWRAIL